MSKTCAIAIAVLAALAAPAPAETFDERAQQATRVPHVDDVGWAFLAACDRGDEIQQRQCRLVRDRAARALTGATLVLDGDVDAFELGQWSPAKKSLPIRLIGCIRCGGLEIDGQTLYVTGGTPRIDAGKLRPATLFDNVRMFPDEPAATAWAKSLKVIRVQYLVKVPGAIDKRRWQVGGKAGLALDIVGFRVSAPCDGQIVVSNPSSQTPALDANACRDGAIEAGGSPDGVDAITPAMVQQAMKPVVDAARACYERYKASGTARLELTVAADGTVAKVEQTGNFIGTPTAQCIDTAMRGVQFPRTKKPHTSIVFPITVP